MKKIECPNCKYIGRGKVITQGSFLVEIFLWCCFIFPGILYSIWRLSTRYFGCPRCEFRNVIKK